MALLTFTMDDSDFISGNRDGWNLINRMSITIPEISDEPKQTTLLSV